MVTVDPDPPGAGEVNLGQQLVGASPLGAAHQLEVGDLELDSGFECDADHLVKGVEHPLVFVAHMDGQQFVVPGDDSGERCNLLGVAEAAGRINQPEGNTGRALFEHPVKKIAHLRKLVRSELAQLPADDIAAQAAVADQRAEIDGDSVPLDILGIAGHIPGRKIFRGQSE